MPGSFLASYLSLCHFFPLATIQLLHLPQLSIWKANSNLIMCLNFTLWVNPSLSTLQTYLSDCRHFLTLYHTVCYNVGLIIKATLNSVENLYVYVIHIQHSDWHITGAPCPPFFKSSKALHVSRAIFKILPLGKEQRSTKQHFPTNILQMTLWALKQSLFVDAKQKLMTTNNALTLLLEAGTLQKEPPPRENASYSHKKTSKL